MQTEHFSTKDDCTIVGDYYQGSGKSGMLLLHMMPASRVSWRAVATKLQQNGFHVLAIDLRGHGESSDGPEGYRAFSDDMHQKSLLDVEAAIGILTGKGVERMHIGGASIGANLAVQYGATYRDVKSMVLLSPGLDYHGIHADISVDNLKPSQALLLVASDDDIYSFTSVKALFDRSSNLSLREVKLLTQAGHGTDMLQAYPALIDELVTWVKKADAK